MQTFTIETINGNRTVTAERCRKDGHGDLVFFNGSKDSPPVRTFFRENLIGADDGVKE